MLIANAIFVAYTIIVIKPFKMSTHIFPYFVLPFLCTAFQRYDNFYTPSLQFICFMDIEGFFLFVLKNGLPTREIINNLELFYFLTYKINNNDLFSHSHKTMK